MTILPELSQQDQDLAEKNGWVLRVAEATHHLAATLRDVNARFWELPTERLLAVLNADLPATFATFAANTAMGMAANASLNLLMLARFPCRAPVEMGRTDIVFDQSPGAFVCLPPVPEEAPPELPATEEG